MSIFGKQKRTARPLSGSATISKCGPFRSGSLGLRGPYQEMRGLGAALGSSAAPGEIPWQCWGITDFQNCHAANWSKNQKICDAGGDAAKYGMTVDDCIANYTAQDDANCVTASCSQYAAVPNATAGQTLPVATVKAAQTQLNADLTRNGYKTIAVDGKLGPATCGAAQYLYTTSPRQSTAWTDYNLYAYCTGTGVNPTLVGQSAPLKSYVASTTTITQGSSSVAVTHQWGVADDQMPILQTQINAILDQFGYNPIPVSGVLDAKTCGAMKWIGDNTGNDLLTMNGQNCQAFTLPTKKPSAGPGKPAVPPAVLPSSGGISKAGMWTGGLLFVALAGGYYYAKKKGMV